MAQAARNSLARRFIAERIDELDWSGAEQSLSERGYAVTAPVLSPAECAELTALYSDASRFRSHIIMERYRFGIGGYNCLHQDLYGEVSFPLQMVFLLGKQGRDWEGGEFILVEQQPRAQSKPQVVLADQGQAIVFTTRYRPVKGSRGYYRVNLRHGVSRVHRGTRYTLGIIFHDAK